MPENLEGKDTSKEETTTTAETKGKESTATKITESTVGIIDTKEFRDALDKALGKATESLNRQVSLSGAEAKQASAKVAEAELLKSQAEERALAAERELEASMSDDTEKRQAYIDRRAIAQKQADNARKDADLARRELEVEQGRLFSVLAKKAIDVSCESGIPINELENCKTEAEMENKGLKFQLTKKEPTETTLPVDPAVSTAVGSASFEQIRDDMIKNPSNDAKMRRYIEAKKEIDSQR